MKAYCDKWENVHNVGEEIEVISFGSIENLIKRLDQSVYMQVILDGKDNYISGGKGQYIVTFVIGNDDDFFTLLNQSKRNEENEIAIVTGGQAGLYPEKMVVDFASTIEASRCYFERYDKKLDLFWINE